MSERLICTLIALGVSVVVNKVLAIHTFKVIDGYVKELFEITKKSIRDAYSGERSS